MEIEKTVYLVRHGQSVANTMPVFQDPSSPLSEIGKKQAESIAERVSRLSFETLISSPYTRAKETAEIIEKVTGKKLEFSDLFMERKKPSSINGKGYDDDKAHLIWREWEASLYNSSPRVEDSENFDDFIARAKQALDFLKQRTEKSIVVVTHGTFLRALVVQALFKESLTSEIFRKFCKHSRHENTGITVLRYHNAFEEDACWRLWIYNDHAHLGD